MTRDIFNDAIIRELEQSVVKPAAFKSVDLRPAAVGPAELHPIDTWARIPSRPAASGHVHVKPVRNFISLAMWFVGAGIVIASLLYVSQNGLRVKNQVVEQGNAAIGHLLHAKQNIEQMNWVDAEKDFTAAKQEFDDAAQQMDVFGPSLTGLLSKVPGLGALESGRAIVQAGRKITDAGQAVTQAMTALSKAGGILDEKSTDRLSLGEIFLPLEDALSRADKDLIEAEALLSDIDTSVLPDDVRTEFDAFRQKMPQLKAIVQEGSNAVSFLGQMTGADHPRRYLVLFQNSSELRPTGGFPGSYGLVTFENGRVQQVQADDIYNPDGQIKDLVVPPLQLQHITPSWGMRDANWFIDFPTSANKVMEYYRRGGGATVDGVFAIRPEVVVEILRLTGPISMPAYDVILTADNFLTTIQLEVESKKTTEPKKIIVDLLPLIMDRMSSAPASQWIGIMEMFKRHLSQRDIMLYFDDKKLQEYVQEQGWSGSVHQTSGDYLMVNISNIKGAKTDAVTDTVAKLEGRVEGGTMVHRLTLTRAHNGLASEYGFYKKTNYSYVRVLVPKGSTLRGISGNDHPNNKALINYSTETNIIRDPDLQKLEGTYQYDAGRDATTYEESGKTGFGFWMKVDPGKTQSVQLEYVVPAKYISSAYTLYVQRQPGLDFTDVELTIEKAGDVKVSSPQPAMTEWPDSWRLHDPLRQDVELNVSLQK